MSTNNAALVTDKADLFKKIDAWAPRARSGLKTAMPSEPEFEVGQIVEATGSYNWRLTRGKRYIVIGVEPELVTPTFTFPVYVTVIGDSGQPVTGHAYRFRAVD